MPAAAEVAIVVLAGGRASRLPGKLAQPLDGVPMLTSLVRRLQSCGAVVVAGRPDPPVDLGGAPVVEDRQRWGGPLRALEAVFAGLSQPLCVAVAGDLPNAGPELVGRLLDAYRAGDEAVVPEHAGRMEPLASLYDRAAFVRASRAALRGGSASMHALLERLAVRRIDAPAFWFLNINTADDFASFRKHGGPSPR